MRCLQILQKRLYRRCFTKSGTGGKLKAAWYVSHGEQAVPSATDVPPQGAQRRRGDAAVNGGKRQEWNAGMSRGYCGAAEVRGGARGGDDGRYGRHAGGERKRVSRVPGR